MLCTFLRINSDTDAVRFGAAIPFVPDVIARYSTSQKFDQMVNETRLTFDQVL